jgi:SAM-dependent methyltransferase
MGIEYIHNVSINDTWYRGEDIYSDGEIEDDVLSRLQKGENEGEILKNDKRWPIIYHFSPTRHNLLSWYAFDPTAHILEVGAGWGGITGLLCERMRSVTAVELSKKRALINALRYQSLTNLKIFVGDINDIVWEEQFDYITLIGVLEYAGYIRPASISPYDDLLKTVRQILKPGGCLILAIENKFGLKYWAGAYEDHNSEPFKGIEGYYGSKVITFGKNSLLKLLHANGFEENDIYYPMPDYKLPHQIFSEAGIEFHSYLNDYFPSFDSYPVRVFDEKRVFNELSQEQMFGFFANSFLVFSR